MGQKKNGNTWRMRKFRSIRAAATPHGAINTVHSAVSHCSAIRHSKPGIDQQTVETPGLRAIGAEIEHAVAALQDPLLLPERWIERHPCPFQHHQRQIGRVERIERGGKVRRPVFRPSIA